MYRRNLVWIFLVVWLVSCAELTSSSFVESEMNETSQSTLQVSVTEDVQSISNQTVSELGSKTGFTSNSSGSIMKDATGTLALTPVSKESSVGNIPIQWRVNEIPTPFHGDWLLRPLENAPIPEAYSNLVFHIAESPADCRLLRIGENAELRQIGTMPFVDYLDGKLYIYFVGEFHLTMELQLRVVENNIEGFFSHSGSGATYYKNVVQLTPYTP